MLVLTCSSTIRDKIIPHAVSWYTGEAAQNEFEDIEADEDDYDDADEDDDEDDEEEEEEDEDKNEEGKTRKKVLLVDHLSMVTFVHSYHIS